MDEHPVVPGGIPLRERLTLAEQWADFERVVFPPGDRQPPEIQRREMRRAFYGGAISLWQLVFDGLDGGRDATELDMAYLSRIRAEFELYAVALQEGRA